MLQTYLIYFGILLLCCWLANQASHSEKRAYVWCIIVLLSLIAGLRSFETGLDTYSYVTKYAYIAQGKSEYAYGLEPSFKAICWLLSRISANETFFLSILALLTNGLIVFRFWDFRKISSFSMMMLCYCCIHYFMTMNGVRQFCAVAIVFYATKYLEQKKLIHFVIAILLAALFHSSALVGIFFVVQYYSYWGRMGREEQYFLLGCTALMPFAAIYVLYITISKYREYFTLRSLNVGLMLPAKLLLLALSLLFAVQLYKRLRQKELEDREGDASQTDKIPWICYAYILGLLFTGMGYFFRQVDRVGWYFYLYEGIYYGMFRKDRDIKNRIFFGGCIAVLLLYAFVESILNNSQGNVPYRFVWQML